MFIDLLQLNLTDMGFKNLIEHSIERQLNDPNSEIRQNKTKCFTYIVYEYASMVIPKYYTKFSNKIYNNIAKFTILALKEFNNFTYREITEFIDSSESIRKLLRIKKSPHYSTLQKFFKKIPTKYITDLCYYITNLHVKKSETIAFDGSGFTADNACKYYAQIRKEKRKSYTKYHIATDVDTRLILNIQAQRGPRHDVHFALTSIRSSKKYKPHYIVADKAYDSKTH